LKYSSGVVALLLGAALLGTANAGDVDRGRLLYSARCVGCHDKSVHNREARKARTFEGIKAQVRRWDAFSGGAWGEAEVVDVTTYLNAEYYKFPCVGELCPDKHAAMGQPGLASIRRPSIRQP